MSDELARSRRETRTALVEVERLEAELAAAREEREELREMEIERTSELQAAVSELDAYRIAARSLSRERDEARERSRVFERELAAAGEPKLPLGHPFAPCMNEPVRCGVDICHFGVCGKPESAHKPEEPLRQDPSPGESAASGQPREREAMTEQWTEEPRETLVYFERTGTGMAVQDAVAAALAEFTRLREENERLKVEYAAAIERGMLATAELQGKLTEAQEQLRVSVSGGRLVLEDLATTRGALRDLVRDIDARYQIEQGFKGMGHNILTESAGRMRVDFEYARKVLAALDARDKA